VYADFDFEVPLGRGWYGAVGDSYDRYYVRILELKQSCRILRQCLEGMPEGDYMAKMPRKIKPALDEAYAAVEAARGEMGYYVDSATWPLTELMYTIFMVAAAGLAFVFALHFAGLFIFFERRIAARMQSRVGPNRVGPNGVIQWAVDGIKCLFKEDLVPNGAD